MKRDVVRGRLMLALLFGMALMLAVFDIPKSAAATPDNKEAAVTGLENEAGTINKAAQANNCNGQLRAVLYAIRKAENGPAGTEFGVIHPRAVNTNLDTQARWAAATVAKNYERWQAASRPGDFITFLGQKYSPPTSAAVNANWRGNVQHWYNRIDGRRIE